MAGRNNATRRTTFLSLSLVYPTSSSSSSSPTSPTFSSQEAVILTQYLASTKSESTSEEVRGSSSHDLPECEEFKGNLVDESVGRTRSVTEHKRAVPQLLHEVVWWDTLVVLILSSNVLPPSLF